MAAFFWFFFFFQAEDGIRDLYVTGVQTCALPISEADKPVLAVRGLDAYVAYNRASKVWVAASHDGANTFTPVNLNPVESMGWAQAGGATIDPAGNIFLSWAGYTRTSAGQGPVDLYVGSSTDGGKNWTTSLLDVSGAPPECAT